MEGQSVPSRVPCVTAVANHVHVLFFLPCGTAAVAGVACAQDGHGPLGFVADAVKMVSWNHQSPALDPDLSWTPMRNSLGPQWNVHIAEESLALAIGRRWGANGVSFGSGLKINLWAVDVWGNISFSIDWLVGSFKHCFFFHNIWDNHSHWLSYLWRWLKHVKTTNQLRIVWGFFFRQNGPNEFPMAFAMSAHHKFRWPTFWFIPAWIIWIFKSGRIEVLEFMLAFAIKKGVP